MIHVLWAPQAIQDVEAIRAHVARDSAHYADLVVERLVAAIERLRDHPRSGRVVAELGDESIREVIHGSYRMSERRDIGASNFRIQPSAARFARCGC